jgi:acetyl esterase/lipase
MGPSRTGLATVVVLVLAGCVGDAGEVVDSAASAAETTGASPAVLVTDDVVYATSLADGGSADGKPWGLDTYAPEEGQDLPVVVLLHGGGTSKENYSRASESIAQRGVIVFAIDAPMKSPVLMLQDNGKDFRAFSEFMACAIAYARETAADFGGDPDRVLLVAHSLGALYGAWYALGARSLPADWADYAESHDGPPMQVACEKDSSSTIVEAFVGIGGDGWADIETEDPDLSQIVDPFAYVGQDLSLPVRFLHGDLDSAEKGESAMAFSEDLSEAGYDSEFAMFEGGHDVPPELTYETVVQLTGS